MLTADTAGGWRRGLLASARAVLEEPMYPCREPGSCPDLEGLHPTTLGGISGCGRKSSLGSAATQPPGVRGAALLQPLGTVPTPCLHILGRLDPKVGAKIYSSSRNSLFHLPTSTHTQPHTDIHTITHIYTDTQPHTQSHTHTHNHAHNHTIMHIHTYTQPHTYTHNHIDIETHTLIHT